jgi:hypothetical protein
MLLVWNPLNSHSLSVLWIPYWLRTFCTTKLVEKNVIHVTATSSKNWEPHLRRQTFALLLSQDVFSSIHHGGSITAIPCFSSLCCYPADRLRMEPLMGV